MALPNCCLVSGADITTTFSLRFDGIWNNLNFGRSIKICRLQRGLSQENLAKRAGISVSYLSLLEQNKRDPSLSTIQAISDGLRVPVSILAFLGSEPSELSNVPENLREKLAATALLLMNAE